MQTRMGSRKEGDPIWTSESDEGVGNGPNHEEEREGWREKDPPLSGASLANREIGVDNNNKSSSSGGKTNLSLMTTMAVLWAQMSAVKKTVQLRRNQLF